MAREVTTTVYTFEELSDEAKDRALEHYRNISVDDSFWHEHMTEVRSPYAKPYYQGDFQERAENAGFTMSAFYFSGFWSQGDGACFTASVDYEEYIRKNRLGNKYRCLLRHVERDGGGLSIGTSGNYCHAYTMHVEDADRYFSPYDDTARAADSSDKADAQAEELIDEILEHAQDLAHEFYCALEEEHDYLTSDEQVADALEANCMTFTEDGDPFFD